jgi:hypothetical protein
MGAAHHRTIVGICLASAVGAGQLPAAPLKNGNFSPSFTPWQGEIENADFDVSATDPDSDGRFSLLGGGLAQIETDPNPDPTANIIAVDLFQTFDLSPWAQAIRFDYAWTQTEPGYDYVGALLASTVNPSWFIGLFDGLDTLIGNASGWLDVDISSLAGERVQLSFRIEDGGDDRRDWLRVGNLQIVPAPATGLLVGVGIFALARLRRRT